MTVKWPTLDGGVETFEVQVDDILYLTEPPPRDIFSDQTYVNLGQPVLDFVVDYVENEKGMWKKDHKLVLIMPSDKITPGLNSQCEAAIDRYADIMITDNRHRMAGVRRKGLLQIPYSMIFLTACVGLGLAFGNQIFSVVPEYLSTVLGEGFFIIGWVALWGPTESLLFERSPYIWRNRALKALKRMTVEIRAR